VSELKCLFLSRGGADYAPATLTNVSIRRRMASCTCRQIASGSFSLPIAFEGSGKDQCSRGRLPGDIRHLAPGSSHAVITLA
jgi:hypothetical protein